ncbi:MAG: N-acetylmuramoyl-L-alanine amidase [Candidatus Brocadiia bacterium]|jgi:N-acetylmuramoyl-L-alanine amidase
MPLTRSARRPDLLRILPLLLTLCLPLAAFAEAGYVSVLDLAREFGLQYKDMTDGAVHAGRLTGKDIKVVLFADVQSITINGVSVALAHPVRWNGATLEVPEEAADLITGKTEPPARTDSLATPPQPVLTAPLRRTRTLSGARKVVIDPGHGGDDTGTPARLGNLNEKQIALEVALAVGAHLRSQGVTVIFTRTTDVRPSLEERADLANRENPDLFVSIHVNADARKELRGATAYYPAARALDSHPAILDRARAAVEDHEIRPALFGADGPVGNTALLAVTEAAFESNRSRSIEAGRCVLRELAPVTGLIEHDNGLVEDYRSIHVLRETHCPAVLIEMDFLSNRMSERKLNTQAYRTAIAQAISEGLMTFLSEPEEGTAP